MNEKERGEAYWKANLRLVSMLLAVWFLVSYGFGTLFVEALNTISIGGMKLEFFFAQQGSIYVFVALIFIYVVQMSRLDCKFDVDEG
jgi:putative solute:sodium symporter small subunit